MLIVKYVKKEVGGCLPFTATGIGVGFIVVFTVIRILGFVNGECVLLSRTNDLIARFEKHV
ncbi:MAG: hypothetical protein WC295_04425 [Methanoregula sp.]|nr:hypothetical protein [Methanoregula sp.]